MPFTYSFKGLDDLRSYFKKLLNENIVDEILLPKLNSAKDNYIQTLISNPELIDDTNPFVPVIPIQTGRIAKNLTFTNSGKKILIVCKPCEIKAIVELTKFKQVNLDNVYLMAVDCVGTYEVKVFSELLLNNSNYVDNYFSEHSEGKLSPAEGFGFRKACAMCDTPVIDESKIDGVLGFFGAGTGEIIFIASDKSNLKDTVEFKEEELSKRDEIVEKIVKEKSKTKEDILSSFREETNSLEKLQEVFSKCIRCHNCMVACPICYCKECVFRSPTFDHSADMLTKWAERKGALRMLENTLMFHLTRLNHMSSSCIACGLCSSACPNDIDVSTVFISVGDNVQKMLEYKAGENFDEPAPVSTFIENELVAEAGTNE
jgi:formate dehydrogenase subunit beta